MLVRRLIICLVVVCGVATVCSDAGRLGALPRPLVRCSGVLWSRRAGSTCCRGIVWLWVSLGEGHTCLVFLAKYVVWPYALLTQKAVPEPLRKSMN